MLVYGFVRRVALTSPLLQLRDCFTSFILVPVTVVFIMSFIFLSPFNFIIIDACVVSLTVSLYVYLFYF
jgi:hypothetical protein